MSTRAVLQPILDHIENNHCTDLTAQALAERAGFSLYYFSRLFHRMTGYPIGQYIRRRRLLHAIYAIRCGQTGIAAALQYGFSTYSGFYRAFVREFGCTPTAYLRAGHATQPRRIDLTKEERIPMTHELAAAVLRHWELSHLPLRDVFYESTGERNEHAVYVGADYVLKFSTDLTCLQTHLQLSSALAAQGILTAAPIPTLQGEDILAYRDGYFFLSRRLPGSPLRAADLLQSEDLAKQFGENLAKLHLALSHIACPVQKTDLPTDVLTRALPRVRDLLPLSADFTRSLRAVLTDLYPKLPQQIIHRDPNPSNFLVSYEGWSFLDFDLSQRNIRLFDLCYAASAVLSEILRAADKPQLSTWIAFYPALLRGYDAVAALTPEEKTALPYILLASQFICLAWFADQPQYPDLFSANKRMTTYLLDHFDALRFPQ